VATLIFALLLEWTGNQPEMSIGLDLDWNPGYVKFSLIWIGSGVKRNFWLHAKCTSEVGPDPECRSRLRHDCAFFFWTRIRTWSQKFWKNQTPNRSLFSISVAAGVCLVIS